MLEYAAATRLHRQLTELPELLAHAHLALQPGSAPRGGRVSGATRTAPLPCRADVLSLLGPAARGTVHDPYGDQDGITPIAGTIQTWARLIAEETHQCLITGTIGGHLQFLTRRTVLAWSVLQPWADDYAAEIHGAHRRLTPLALLRPRRRMLALPCPQCTMLTLVAEDGRDIECIEPSCRAVLRQHEYDNRAEQYIAELQAA
jgi:hypothetical protein